MNILIVRLGALGDIVHTVPAAAALRLARPDARLDWLVDAHHAAFVELVTVVERVIRLERPSAGGWIEAVRHLRRTQYDAALDFQGLLKSAALARASGARRVIGFATRGLREKSARPFYSEVEAVDDAGHVIRKNLRLLSSLGVTGTAVNFPLARVDSPACGRMIDDAGGRPIALLNPGAAWPNKRWPARRFGEVAAFVREARGLVPYVLWGPGERALAEEVAAASGGAARIAPATTTADLVEVCRRAALMVSGDTGPLHVAGAVGTPLVAIFGPTDPGRNGPWSEGDLVVSRHAACGCSYQRRCTRTDWCLGDLATAEVTAAIERRLGHAERREAAE